MSTKRIVFAVLCALLVLVLIMTVVTAVKLVQMFNSPTPTEPTETEPSVSESTGPSTAPSTEATTPPTSKPTVPPTTQPTESTGGEHTHNFDTVLSSQAPTCTDSGYKELLCSCGETQWQVVDKREHDYGHGEIVPVSCTSDGYVLYTCKVCSAEDKRNFVEKTGHNYGSGVLHKATCTEDAYTLYTCANANCPEKEKKDVQPNTKLGHNFGAWVGINGTMTQTCGICDASYTTDDLKIQSRFRDDPNNAFRVYELDVGPEENPALYRYKITDYINNNTLSFSYDYETGLTIKYNDNSGTPHEVVLSNVGGQHTIENVTSGSQPPESSQPSESSEPSEGIDPNN